MCFDVSARTLASHSLCIFGDHQDVMACRQTGFAMLCEGSVQEVMDLTAVAHLASLKTCVPFVNFFDGFRTSHEYHKIELMEEDDIRPLVDEADIKRFRDRALSPERPVTRGTAENPESFFTHREACNEYYDKVPEVVEMYLGKISEITGREYHLFSYYGAEDADRIIILMGSATEAAREAIDYLNANGQKVGMVSVHLYRPFSVKHLLAAVPKTVKRIAVLDRTKEPGAEGEPLYLDVKSAFYDVENKPLIVGGRYGLGSSDTTPAKIISVFNNLALPEPKTISLLVSLTMLHSHRCHRLKRWHWAEKACSRPSSTDWVLTVLLVQTRTPSRLSATTPTSTARHTSLTTQRSLVVSPAHTCALVTPPFVLLIW